MITVSCLTNAKCSLIEFSNTTNVVEIMKYIRTSEYLQMQLAQHESITVSTNMIPNVNKTFTEKTIDDLFEYVKTLLDIMFELNSIYT